LRLVRAASIGLADRRLERMMVRSGWIVFLVLHRLSGPFLRSGGIGRPRRSIAPVFLDDSINPLNA
jgi:hypothetical protein